MLLKLHSGFTKTGTLLLSLLGCWHMWKPGGTSHSKKGFLSHIWIPTWSFWALFKICMVQYRNSRIFKFYVFKLSALPWMRKVGIRLPHVKTTVLTRVQGKNQGSLRRTRVCASCGRSHHSTQFTPPSRHTRPDILPLPPTSDLYSQPASSHSSDFPAYSPFSNPISLFSTSWLIIHPEPCKQIIYI